MIGDVLIFNAVATAFLVLLIYLVDFNEKEPVWTLVRIYVLSIILTFLFGKVKSIFIGSQTIIHPLINHYLIAGFLEELLKLMIVFLFVWPLKTLNEEVDGIVYYLIVAAGFTVIENVGYTSWFVMRPFMYGQQTGQLDPYHFALQKIVCLRFFSGHIFVNIVSGVFLGYAKRLKKIWILVPGFFLSVLLHGLWNHSASFGLIGWYAFFFTIIDIGLLIWIRKQSFYYKFMQRLKDRVRGLIEQAKEFEFNPDIISLMQSICQDLNRLCMKEGAGFKSLSRKIIFLLPDPIKTDSTQNETEIMYAMVRIFSLLHQECPKLRFDYWILFFLKFAIPGFLVMAILMNFV